VGGVTVSSRPAPASPSRPLAISILTLIAATPFQNYVTSISAYGMKLLGGLVLVLFLAEYVRVPERPERSSTSEVSAMTTSRLVLIFLLLASVSTMFHPNGGTGVQTYFRYLSFGVTYFVLVFALRSPSFMKRAFAVWVAAASLAGICGLIQLASGLTPDLRARGPMHDPNDLAFMLVTAIPIGVGLARLGRRRFWTVCVVLCAIGSAATLSRGAAVSLGVLAVWGIATRMPSARVLGLGLAVAAVGLIGLSVVSSSLIHRSVGQKGTIAASNVTSREDRWQAAIEMMSRNPLVGVGPAGFGLTYRTYLGPYDPVLQPAGDFTHEMYLEVGAELGGPALIVFLCVVGNTWRTAYEIRRTKSVPAPTATLAEAIEGSVVIAATASLFLTEQYYLSVWLIAAAAIGLLYQTNSEATIAHSTI
jgi:putative inorganic carbon (HCO3(-)) transporter